ncbi:MAG: three-Cys-motif partner protein TcmP [Allosphingosinicella sp.]
MPGKTWNIEPHTQAKLDILRRYLQAWFPILSMGRHPRVVYIDGFAGPGRYEGGEEGSPLIALRAVLNQPLALGAALEFHFVEADPEVRLHLESELDEWAPLLRGRPRVSVEIHGTEFAAAYPAITKRLGSSDNVVPTFALIDPFGWTGVPFSIVSELLGRGSTEVVFNFMHEEINRFLAHSDQPENFDALFGVSTWRECLPLKGHRRTYALHDLYQNQLRTRCRYVRSFTMVNRSKRVDYFLFFGTNSLKGLERMKDSMWKVAPTGDFCFSDATDPEELTLFGSEPDLRVLAESMRQHHRGEFVLVDELYKWALTDTPFLAKHVRETLRGWEREGPGFEIRAPAGRRRGTFPEGRGILILVPE